MNAGAFDQLPPDVRRAVTEVGAEMSDYGVRFAIESADAAQTEIAGKAYLHKVDTAAMRARVGPLYDRTAEELEMWDVLERIRTLA